MNNTQINGFGILGLFLLIYTYFFIPHELLHYRPEGIRLNILHFLEPIQIILIGIWTYHSRKIMGKHIKHKFMIEKIIGKIAIGMGLITILLTIMVYYLV